MASDEKPGAAVELGEDWQALSCAIGRVRARALKLGTDEAVPSPCIAVCRLSTSGATQGLCVGCFRTGGEIAAWSRASEDDKRSLWRTIEQRMAALVA